MQGMCLLLIGIEAHSPHHAHLAAACKRLVVVKTGCVRELQAAAGVLRELKDQRRHVFRGPD